MTIHEMKVQPAPFEAIKTGNKIIESRVYDEKRQQIKIGDQILFRNTADLNDTVSAKVEGLLRYGTFSSLFTDFPPSFFGGESKDVLEAQIDSFYSKQDEAKYGVLGIRISKV